MKLAIGLFALAASLPAGAMTLTTSPQQIFPSGRIQSIKIHEVPGFCGKVYIGNSAMGNVATINGGNYSGVIRMYPNCTGGLSDKYEFEDRSGTDGIDATQFYIEGSEAGDIVLVEAYATGNASSGTLTIAHNSFVQNLGWVVGELAPGQAAALQFSVIPGFEGKIHVGDATYLEAFGLPPNFQPLGYPWSDEYIVLYPNNGTVTGTITDRWDVYTPDGQNHFLENQYTTYAEVPGEGVLATVWERS